MGILQNVVPVSLPPAKSPLVRFGVAVIQQKACAPVPCFDELELTAYWSYSVKNLWLPSASTGSSPASGSLQLVARVGIEPTDVQLMRLARRLFSILAIYKVSLLFPLGKKKLRFYSFIVTPVFALLGGHSGKLIRSSVNRLWTPILLKSMCHVGQLF